MEEKKYLRVLTKGAAFVFVGIAVSKILSYAYRLLIARLGPADYGLLSLGLAMLGALTAICLFGMPQAIMRFIAHYDAQQDLRRLHGTIRFSTQFSLVASLVIAAAVFFASDKIATVIFHDGRLAIIIKLISLAVPFDVVRNNLWSITKAFQRAEYEVYSRYFAENILKFALTALLFYFGFRVFGAAFALVGSIVLSCILAIHYTKKLLPKTDASPISVSSELLRYSLPLTFNSIFSMALTWTDTIMLGHFTTAALVGVYNAAVPLSQLLYFFPLALLTLLLPILTSLYSKKNIKAFSDVYKTATKWIYLANIIFIGIFVIFSSQLLSVFFGSSYVSGGPALLILSAGQFVYFLSLPCNLALLVYKKTKLVFFISGSSGLLNILLNFILINKYGISGAAFATSISLLFMGILNFLFARRVTKIAVLQKSYVRPLLAAAASTFFIFVFVRAIQTYLSPSLLLLFSLLAISALYVLFLRYLHAFDKVDSDILQALLQKAGLRGEALQKFIKWFANSDD